MRVRNATKRFWSAIAERAIKTFAQAFIAAYPIGSALHVDALSMAFSIGASAALYSVMTSLVSLRIGKNGPSLASETVLPSAVDGH